MFAFPSSLVLERCDRPTVPSDGFINTTLWTVGTTIAYSCLEGHILIGDETRTCQRDLAGELQWTGTPPSCLLRI